MKLLLIHGRPAVGKLTVARLVARETGGRLFHNHLTVNLALSVFPFGSPAFVALREEIWTRVLGLAASEGVPLLIFTFNPENTVTQAFIDRIFAESTALGTEVIPVELTAPEEEIERRLASESRLADGKTLDAAGYRRLRESGAFLSPRIRGSRLVLDMGRLSPAEAAARIGSLLGSAPR
jgi:MoxR-like ATPase